MANEELIGLIAERRDNLSCAWDIVSVIDQVEELLRTRFWDSVHQSLLQEFQKLTDPELKAGWSVQVDEAITTRQNRLKADRGIYVSANESPMLQLGIWQYRQKIHYGVAFCSPQQDPLRDEVEALGEALPPPEWTRPDKWWLAYHDSGYHVWRGSEFLLSVAADALAVSQPMTDCLIKIFRERSKQVIAANTALAHGA